MLRTPPHGLGHRNEQPGQGCHAPHLAPTGSADSLRSASYEARVVRGLRVGLSPLELFRVASHLGHLPRDQPREAIEPSQATAPVHRQVRHAKWMCPFPLWPFLV